jgi:hypothetical protein
MQSHITSRHITPQHRVSPAEQLERLRRSKYGVEAADKLLAEAKTTDPEFYAAVLQVEAVLVTPCIDWMIA